MKLASTVFVNRIKLLSEIVWNALLLRDRLVNVGLANKGKSVVRQRRKASGLELFSR